MANEDVRGISTYQTYFMCKSSGTWGKALDITSFPDLVPPKEKIDITTLSDYMRVYINGIGDTGSDMNFGANYTATNFANMKALEGHQYEYAVWFGATGSQGSEVPDGHNGKFSWTGDVSVGLSGGGVNEAVSMTVNCTPSTVVTFAES